MESTASNPEATTDKPADTTADKSTDAPGTTAAHAFVERAAQTAHDAIDAVANRVDSLVDGVGGRGAALSDARDDWVGAAREAITTRPFAAIGIALLLGAGIVSLRSRDR